MICRTCNSWTCGNNVETWLKLCEEDENNLNRNYIEECSAYKPTGGE